jgi:hypothetical protein
MRSILAAQAKAKTYAYPTSTKGTAVMSSLQRACRHAREAPDS